MARSLEEQLANDVFRYFAKQISKETKEHSYLFRLCTVRALQADWKTTDIPRREKDTKTLLKKEIGKKTPHDLLGAM